MNDFYNDGRFTDLTIMLIIVGVLLIGMTSIFVGILIYAGFGQALIAIGVIILVLGTIVFMTVN